MSEEKESVQTSQSGQAGEEAAATPAAVAKSGSNLRLKILLGLLLLCVIDVAYEKVWGNMLARSLKPFAEEKMAEFSKNPGGLKEEYASGVSAAREYVMFGERLGKVSIYIRSSDEGGEHYSEVDYFYEKDGSGWKFKESGGCDESQCRPEAMRAFGLKPTPAPPVPVKAPTKEKS
ncbi:MAG: hypothetical protein HZB26_09680 [Candidatus Hydrogenedentes bacterium]|nr:hypothetical protein [Candidatus Hydrogenedentota bacterium]